MTVDEDIDFTKLIENFQQNKSSAATLKQQGSRDIFVSFTFKYSISYMHFSYLFTKRKW